MKKIMLYVIGLYAILIGIFVFNPGFFLKQLGTFLLYPQDAKQSVDLAVVLRGGSDYDRLLEAHEIWRSGYSQFFLIPRSLGDGLPKILTNFGVSACGNKQKIWKNILLQLGIPGRNIILDGQLPGGGTMGEARRVEKFLASRIEYKNVMVITSWYHVRRTKKIYQDVFKESDININVVPALSHSLYNPENWWKFRYQAITVLEEYVKLILNPFHDQIIFNDDTK